MSYNIVCKELKHSLLVDFIYILYRLETTDLKSFLICCSNTKLFVLVSLQYCSLTEITD